MSLPLTPLIQTASLAFSFATNSRNVFKMLKEVTDEDKFNFTVELIELSSLVFCVNEPFYLCCQLQVRQETIGCVDAAVAYSKRVLRRCELFFVEKERESERQEEEDGTSISWKNWLTNERKATLMKLCSDIKTVVNILNLAITTAKMKIGVFDPSSDLSKSVESEKIARDVKFRLDCGRLSEVKLATGEVYEFVQTPVKRKPGQKTKDLVNKGYANVWVTQTEISKYILTLKFSHENLEDHDDDKVDSVDVNFLLPSKSFKLRKQRKKDLENGILCNSDTDQFDLCYSLVQNKRICYLIFESPGALSAQTFEEFILLLQGDHVKNSEEDVDKLSNLMDKVGFETPQKD